MNTQNLHHYLQFEKDVIFNYGSLEGSYQLKMATPGARKIYPVETFNFSFEETEGMKESKTPVEIDLGGKEGTVPFEYLKAANKENNLVFMVLYDENCLIVFMDRRQVEIFVTEAGISQPKASLLFDLFLAGKLEDEVMQLRRKARIIDPN